MADKSENYISLQQAAKFCKYSQEYLSLRARQGKLKSLKLGRNWVTKKEWLEGYLATVENYNNILKVKRIKKEKTVKIEPKIIPSPPRNLPTGEIEFVPVVPFEYRFFEFLKTPAFRIIGAMSVVFFLAAAGVIWQKDNLLDGSKVAYESVESMVRESFSGARDDVSDVMIFAEEKISGDEIYSAAVYDAADIFKDYFKWIGESPTARTIGKSIKFVWQNSREGYIILGETIFNGADRLTEGAKKIRETIGSNFSRAKEFVLNWFRPSKPEPAKEGLVVIPSTEKDEEIKEKIKESFSDEVKVEPADKTSGIITPVFRTGEGDRYLYILVPIKN